jgi:hypothetical protein
VVGEILERMARSPDLDGGSGSMSP